MVFSRDNVGNNTLNSLLEHGRTCVAKRFLDYHVSSTDSMLENINGKTALCLDLSCMVGKEIRDETLMESERVVHETDQSKVITTMLKRLPQRHELFQHPVVNTFVTIKYNNYAMIVNTIIFMRLLFCLAFTTLLSKGCDLTSRSNDRTACEAKTALFWVCVSYMFIHCFAMIIRKVVILKSLNKIDWKILFCITPLHLSTLIYLVLLLWDKRITTDSRTGVDTFGAILVLLSWIYFTGFLRYMLVGRLYNLGT